MKLVYSIDPLSLLDLDILHYRVIRAGQEIRGPEQPQASCLLASGESRDWSSKVLIFALLKVEVLPEVQGGKVDAQWTLAQGFPQGFPLLSQGH